MLVLSKCPICQRTRELEVRDAGFIAWQNGALIQNALPELNPSQREALMTGICDNCWPKEDDDDND